MVYFYRSIKTMFQGGASGQWTDCSSVPVAHAIHMKECYENMQVLKY
jgi:hypothetical protein